jgi:hypothetical protein
MTLALRIVVSALVGSDHPDLLLNRPSPEQDLPVVLPRVGSECGGDQDDLRASTTQPLIERRKAKVVADTQPEASNLGVDHDSLVSRSDGIALLEHRSTGDVHIKQVEFAVDRAKLPRRVEDDRVL